MKKLLGLQISVIVFIALLIVPISNSFAQEKPQNTTSLAKSSSISLKLVPDHGPAGTSFLVQGTVPVIYDHSGAFVTSPWESFFLSFDQEGDYKTTMKVPTNANPGTYSVKSTLEIIGYKNSNAKMTSEALFTVTGKVIPTTNSQVAKDQLPLPIKPAPVLKGSSETSTPSKTGTSSKGLTLPSTTSSSASNSGSSNQPQSIPKPVSKRADQNGNPVDSGDSFAVFKTVVGGDATPNEFKYTLILTGPSGTAQYSIGPTLGQGNPSETLPFDLDLPKGNTLSEGTFQIIETNPGDYTPTYSKGCSGSYANDGYYYTCSITNTKKVTNSVTSVVKGGPLPPQPTLPKTGQSTLPTNTGKLTLPTVPNTGKLTLPTVPNTGKLTLPTVPNTGKLTLPITPSKTIATIAPKIPSVHSCPPGSTVANGKCLSKGQVIALIQ